MAHESYAKCWGILLVVVLGCLGVEVRAYSSGAPTKACEDMFPTGHRSDAQTSSPPYGITLSDDTYSAGSNIIVTIADNEPNTWYEGLFVQARLARNCRSTTPLGTFSLGPGETFLKTINCAANSNAVTHNASTPTASSSFTWTAPATPVGHIYFRATVVFNKTTFWTNVYSLPVADSTDDTPAELILCSAGNPLPTLASLPLLLLSALLAILAV